MKQIRSIFLAAAVLWAAPSLWAAKYNIDPAHSDVSFRVRHMMVSKVGGRFEAFSGTFEHDSKNLKLWKAEAVIQTGSINTSNAKRDAHLKSPDFFDAQKYPTLTFKSTEVTDATPERAKLHGLLNIHGIEKPVVFDLEIHGVVKDPWGNTRAAFTAAAKINRKDFGLTWNQALETGQLLVGEEVALLLEVEGLLQE